MSLKKNVSDFNPFSDYSIAAALFLITLFISSFFGVRSIDFHHQGIMFNGAISFFSESGIIYKDFYYHYGPLTSLLHATAMLVAGKKLTSIIYFTCLIYAFVSAQIYLLNRQTFNKNISTLITLISIAVAPYYFWTLLPWSSVISIPFFLWIFKLLLSPSQKSTPIFIGISIAAIFFIRQSSGILLLVGFIAAVILSRFNKNLLKALCISLIIIAITYLVFIYFGFFQHYFSLSFTEQIKWTANHVSGENFLIKILKDIFARPGDTGYFFFNLLALFLLLRTSQHAITYFSSSLEPSKIALFTVAWVSISQMSPVVCDRHFYWSMLPVIPIIAIEIKNITSTPWLSKYRFLIPSMFVILALSFSGEVYHRIKYGINKINTTNLPINGKTWPVLQGMYTDTPTLQFLTTLSKVWTSQNQTLKIKERYSLLPYINKTDFSQISTDTIFVLNTKEQRDSLLGFCNWQPAQHKPRYQGWLYYKIIPTNPQRPISKD